MRLEYFQLIDRIVDLKIADRKITTEATVPEIGLTRTASSSACCAWINDA